MESKSFKFNFEFLYFSLIENNFIYAIKIILEFIRSTNVTVAKVMYLSKDLNRMQMVCMLALR